MSDKLVDIDSKDKDDPQAVAQYVNDIYNYYKESESVYRPHDYMNSQTDINEKMRSILVDWLIEVHMKFKVNPSAEESRMDYGSWINRFVLCFRS